MEPLRVLLVDDHALFREGLAMLLAGRSDIQVVGQAVDGHQGIEMARAMSPDVILMDIEMPGCNGLQATETIKRERPETHIIILTVSDTDEHLFSAIKRGAAGYLLKNMDPPQLFSMLEGIRRGESPISGVLAAKLLREFRNPEASAANHAGPREELTPRETEVLELLVTGDNNREIAEKLDITENTVKIHLRNILEKLHLRNRIQAAVYAVRRGLVDPEIGGQSG